MNEAGTRLGDLGVVDFMHFIAGPSCTIFLADSGVEVAWIESPSTK